MVAILACFFIVFVFVYFAVLIDFAEMAQSHAPTRAWCSSFLVVQA